MSGAGFHVHGPHDHEVEHAAQHGDKSSGKIAVATAVLATMGAFFSYMAGDTQNAAMLHKNNAAIIKTEASNKWNYYQAKSNKQNLAELSIELTQGERQEFYKKEVERYKGEKKVIQVEAEKLEISSKEEDKMSDGQMHLHHRWAQAMTAISVAIALAAIALLTKRKWLEIACGGVASLGVVLGLLAVLHI
jgi:lipopolysaccharide export LptBFGC system permease protein LptF